MAYNLKAGLMATTTMVGSAVAYTKTQPGEGNQQGSSPWNQGSGQAKTQQHKSAVGNQTQSQKQGEVSKYKDTFEQMMMWK